MFLEAQYFMRKYEINLVCWQNLKENSQCTYILLFKYPYLYTYIYIYIGTSVVKQVHIALALCQISINSIKQLYKAIWSLVDSRIYHRKHRVESHKLWPPEEAKREEGYNLKMLLNFI